MQTKSFEVVSEPHTHFSSLLYSQPESGGESVRGRRGPALPLCRIQPALTSPRCYWLPKLLLALPENEMKDWTFCARALILQAPLPIYHRQSSSFPIPPAISTKVLIHSQYAFDICRKQVYEYEDCRQTDSPLPRNPVECKEHAKKLVDCYKEW